MSPRATATLEPDLEAGLKRLKLAAVRKMAPEVLKTAKVQRWPPEELLRTFVEAEIAARDASNERARRRAASEHLRHFVTEDELLGLPLLRRKSLPGLRRLELLLLVGNDRQQV